jgi:hypothetical protein
MIRSLVPCAHFLKYIGALDRRFNVLLPPYGSNVVVTSVLSNVARSNIKKNKSPNTSMYYSFPLSISQANGRSSLSVPSSPNELPRRKPKSLPSRPHTSECLQVLFLSIADFFLVDPRLLHKCGLCPFHTHASLHTITRHAPRYIMHVMS